MKRILFFIVLLITCSGANANCIPNSAALSQTHEVINRLGGWPIAEEKCIFLNKHNLSLKVTTFSSIFEGSAVAWASVSLIEKDKHIVSDLFRAITYHMTQATSMAEADKLMYEAVREAIQKLDFEVALRQIRSYQSKK